MIGVVECHCRHAQQIHQTTDGTLCRGFCWVHGHDTASHTGACTAAKCACAGFTERKR